MNQQPIPMQVELEELYKIIGESVVVRHYLQKQIFEMSQEIEKLRAENGKLGSAEDNDPIRRVPGGMQGAGRGFGDDVSQFPNESATRFNKAGSSPD